MPRNERMWGVYFSSEGRLSLAFRVVESGIEFVAKSEPSGIGIGIVLSVEDSLRFSQELAEAASLKRKEAIDADEG